MDMDFLLYIYICFVDIVQQQCLNTYTFYKSTEFRFNLKEIEQNRVYPGGYKNE